MDAARPLVPVIVGPTSVGKTAVAVALADYWPVTVLSADSRQVYRALDIGTGKPDRRVLDRVPHLGIDVVEPGERYSAGRFARDAKGWLGQLDGGCPVVVGGTGLYVRAVADGLFREPPMDGEARAAFRTWAAAATGLGGWAARLDPGYRGGGRHRAARTVEVALLTGRPLSVWQREAKRDSIMRPWYVRLTVPRQFLYARIEERVEAMVRAGWIEEVEALLDRGVPADAPGLDALGYREIVRFLGGHLARDALSAAIVASTRHYAKRQGTWFRHQLLGDQAITLDATDPPSTLARRIVELWEDAVR